MTVEKLRSAIDSELQDIAFDYYGERACIIPRGSKKYTIGYGDVEKDYSGVDALMNDKFFHGKSLNEIAGELDPEFY